MCVREIERDIYHIHKMRGREGERKRERGRGREGLCERGERERKKT